MKKVLIALTIIILTLMVSLGETDEIYEKRWVMCQPDSLVYVRAFPSTRSEVSGYLYLGDEVLVDGKKKNGFYHVFVSTEAGEGWVSRWFLDEWEPVIEFGNYVVVSKGRLAARKGINGNRRCWLKNGDVVKVYAMSFDWAVTNKGYVKSKYLEEVIE